MKITSTQKVIKVGSSNAVTIPAKDLRRLGVKTGDSLDITFEKSKTSIVDEYANFKKVYSETLKNLSDR